MVQMTKCPKCGADNSVRREACFNCGTLLRAEEAENYSAPPAAPTVSPKTNFVENTSGQGWNAPIPSEIRRWNWGAFWFTWIWGLSQNMWEGVLIWFIPIGFMTLAQALAETPEAKGLTAVSSWLIMICLTILFATKGSEWAWQHRRFDGGVTEFMEVQRIWARWGLILVGSTLGIGVLLFIIMIIALA
jgi:hypothetical protein